MFGGFPRLVCGLARLATICATGQHAGHALAQEPSPPVPVAEAPESPDSPDDTHTATQLVASRGATGAANEREYIVQAPMVHRPSACDAEQNLVRLAGTVYDARHPERSMAMIGPVGSTVTSVYRAGSRYGGFELLEVRPHAVLLTRDREDSPCWLKMMRPNPNAPPPVPAAAPAPPPVDKKERRKAFTNEELTQNIQQLGPGVYRVNRTMLDLALARAPKLARTTRTKTVKQHGMPTGMALRSIESGGLFEHLGLKKGDVLKTVNGFDMSSVDGMLSARTQLSSAPHLSLALTRGGQPVTLEYRVQ
jgi:type II secretory pathway component PulC